MEDRQSQTYNIVTIQNIDDEVFEFAYDKVPYDMVPGEVRRFPFFLAEHALKHLIDKILTKNDIRTSNEAERAKLREKIVIDEEQIARPRVKTQAEIMMDEVSDLNRPSDLASLLAKRKAAKEAKKEEVVEETETTKRIVLPIINKETPKEEILPTTPDELEADEPEGQETTTQEVPDEPNESEEDFVGLKDQQPVNITPPSVPEMPTRATLMDYAKNTLKINVDDPKSQKVWKNMKVPELIKEFAYPMGDEE